MLDMLSDCWSAYVYSLEECDFKIISKWTISRHLWSEPQSKWSQYKPNALLNVWNIYCEQCKREPVSMVWSIYSAGKE